MAFGQLGSRQGLHAGQRSGTGQNSGLRLKRLGHDGGFHLIGGDFLAGHDNAARVVDLPDSHCRIENLDGDRANHLNLRLQRSLRPGNAVGRLVVDTAVGRRNEFHVRVQVVEHGSLDHRARIVAIANRVGDLIAHRRRGTVSAGTGSYLLVRVLQGIRSPNHMARIILGHSERVGRIVHNRRDIVIRSGCDLNEAIRSQAEALERHLAVFTGGADNLAGNRLAISPRAVGRLLLKLKLGAGDDTTRVLVELDQDRLARSCRHVSAIDIDLGRRRGAGRPHGHGVVLDRADSLNAIGRFQVDVVRGNLTADAVRGSEGLVHRLRNGIAHKTLPFGERPRLGARTQNILEGKTAAILYAQISHVQNEGLRAVGVFVHAPLTGCQATLELGVRLPCALVDPRKPIGDHLFVNRGDVSLLNALVVLLYSEKRSEYHKVLELRTFDQRIFYYIVRKGFSDGLPLRRSKIRRNAPTQITDPHHCIRAYGASLLFKGIAFERNRGLLLETKLLSDASYRNHVRPVAVLAGIRLSLDADVRNVEVSGETEVAAFEVAVEHHLDRYRRKLGCSRSPMADDLAANLQRYPLIHTLESERLVVAIRHIECIDLEPVAFTHRSTLGKLPRNLQRVFPGRLLERIVHAGLASVGLHDGPIGHFGIELIAARRPFDIRMRKLPRHQHGEERKQRKRPSDVSYEQRPRRSCGHAPSFPRRGASCPVFRNCY